jgi:hypothetical protein
VSRLALLLALGLAAVTGGLWLSFTAAPKLTLTNRGLVFAHATAAPTGALLAAGGALTLAASLRPRRLRAGAALLALGLAALAAQRWLFRVEVGPDRLSVRGLSGVRSVGWTEVTRVDGQAGELILEGRSGSAVRIATASLPPEQQASLERAIARHVATAQRPAPENAPARTEAVR